MFKVDMTGFADGIGCGCREKGIKGETMSWEEEQVGGVRAGGGGNQELHFECFMFEMPFRSPGITSQQPSKWMDIIIPIRQMRKSRLREVGEMRCLLAPKPLLVF